jgi:hypothetical protein
MDGTRLERYCALRLLVLGKEVRRELEGWEGE